ncbi:MAG: glycosyltransferase [bacterium]|nr:glycosyltransferase [bacterium]
MRDACLLLFTKPARPGRVKTRLIGNRGDGSQNGLTAEQAADLHRAFLDDLAKRLSDGRFDLVLAWALDEGEVLPESEHPAVRQEGDDLGERLFSALQGAAEKYRLVGAVGSDHPEVPLEEVERGFALLRGGVDVVLGPAVDGGYYFVGQRAASLRPELFSGIEWSTPEVLETTLQRCRDLSLSLMLLREGSDVDTLEDLDRLSRRLEDSMDSLSGECPRTAELFRQWRSA